MRSGAVMASTLTFPARACSAASPITAQDGAGMSMLLGKKADVYSTGVGEAAEQARAGKVRVLAITAPAVLSRNIFQLFRINARLLNSADKLHVVHASRRRRPYNRSCFRIFFKRIHKVCHRLIRRIFMNDKRSVIGNHACNRRGQNDLENYG